MLRYKVLLVDIDNTLINTENFYKEALKYVYQKYFKPIAPLVSFDKFKEVYQTVRKLNHSNLKATGASHSRTLYFKYLFQYFGLDYDMRLLLNMQKEYWEYALNKARPYKGVHELLYKAKNAFIRIGAVTDNRLETQLKKLDAFDLDRYIDIIVSSEEAGGDKPGQPIFLLALNELGASKSHTLMLGNNPKTDILGGMLIGVNTCLFTPGTMPDQKAETINPTYTISDYEQLEEILMLKNRKFDNSKVIVLDLVGGLLIPNHPLKDIMLPLLKEKGIRVSYQHLVNLYYRLIYGEIPHNQFWRSLGIKDYSGFLAEFFGRMKVSKTVLHLAKDAYKLDNTHLVYATNLYSGWWEYIKKQYDFASLADFVAFPDTVGFRKEDVDYWYQIFFKFSQTKAENYAFFDSNLSVLRTLRHFWGKKIWLKSEEQELIFVPDRVINV